MRSKLKKSAPNYVLTCIKEVRVEICNPQSLMAIRKQQQFEVWHLLLQGKSHCEIAEKLSISTATVSNYRKRLNISCPRKKGGRPHTIEESIRNWVVHAIRSGHVNTAPEVKCLFKLNICNQTIRNVLRAGNL